MGEETTSDREIPVDPQLILYTLEGEGLVCTMRVHLYPAGFDNGSVNLCVFNTYEDRGKPPLHHYIVSLQTHTLLAIPVGELDIITIFTENNGYLYSGGIWQWVDTTQPLTLFGTTGIDLVKVMSLPSAEDVDLVEQAIRQAQHFLDQRFRNSQFIVCRELGELAPEHLHAQPHEASDPRSHEHRWQMYWTCFDRWDEEHQIQPYRGTYRLHIHYYPAQPEGTWAVVIEKEWPNQLPE